MIVKPSVFTDGFIPEALCHRDRELAQVLRMLSAVVQGESSRTLLISGPAGTGKTALVRTVFAGENVGATVPGAVVSVRGQSIPEILRQLLAHHPDTDTEPATQPREALAEQLDEAVTTPYTVVLDDAGTNKTHETLSVLQSVNPIGVIVVARDHSRWLSAHPYEQQESGVDHYVRCQAYTRANLADILEQRAIPGVELRCWSRPTLERIAARAGGNARYAIRLFKWAVRVATQRGHETIQPVDIADATIGVDESPAPR